MAADSPTALLYEPTGWFLSPTLSMVEQLVLWSNLSLVEWGCHRLQKCPQTCMAPTLGLKLQMLLKRPGCTAEIHWLLSHCVQKSRAAQWKLGVSLGSHFPLKTQEPFFLPVIFVWVGHEDAQFFRCWSQLTQVWNQFGQPKTQSSDIKTLQNNTPKSSACLPVERQWVTGSWLPWALLSNWTFYEEITEWLMV